MALYRQIDFNLGTCSDKFGAVPTITGATFAQKEKGLALETGASKYIQYDKQLLPNGAFSVVVWAKLKNNYVAGSLANIIGISNNGIEIAISSTVGYGSLPIIRSTVNNYRNFNYTQDKKWHCYIFTIPGAAQSDISSSALYVDGVALTANNTSATVGQNSRSGYVYIGGGSSASDGALISKIKVYDTVLTQKQIEAEQREFEAAKPILKPKRGFQLNKASDLSDKKYDAAGINLLTNSSFDSNVNSWTPTRASLNWNPLGYCEVTKDASADNTIAISQQVLTVGKRYRISFKAKAPVITSKPFIISGTYFTDIVYKQQPNLTTNWQNYVFEATATVTQMQLYLTDVNVPTGTRVDVDDVYVQELTGLVAAWNFKPNGNTLVDISGNGNNAVLSNVTSSKEGLVFNGATSYGSLTGSSGLTGDISISARVYARGAGEGGYGRLFSTNGVQLIYNGTLVYFTRDGGGTFKTNSSIVANKWYNITVTSTSAGVTNFYIDGALSGSTNQAAGTPSSGTTWYIGNSSANDRTFDGIIQDLKIYNRILTTQEIKAYHNSFAKLPYIVHDFSDAPADGSNVVPMGFIKGTGSYKVGEYVKKYGELVDNGGFDTNTAWGLYNATITGGIVRLNGNGITNTYITQTPSTFSNTKRYKIVFKARKISGSTSLGQVWCSNNSQKVFTLSLEWQVYTFELSASGGIGGLYFYSGIANIVWEVDDVSMTEINPLPTFKQGTKYLECTVAGTIALPSDQAYGTWEWDWYKGADANDLSVSLFLNSSDASIGLGYTITLTSAETIRFVSRTPTSSEKLRTTISYIANNTWYRIKINRTQAGVSTVYIKGGSFGSNWVLVSTSGGTGTNPVTDNTYSSSSYLVLDLDAGDRFTNLVMKKSIEA